MPEATRLPVIALTAGEPAGIGPEICLQVAHNYAAARIVILADRDLLTQRASMLNMSVTFKDYRSDDIHPFIPDVIEILHHPLAVPSLPGMLNAANSAYVIATLRTAAHGCLNHDFDAMVTAPVHKGIINDGGFAFSGHTEFLADETHTKRVVMMLVGGGMRVALATTHLPLRDVAQALNKEQLELNLRILHHDLITRFAIAKPRIVVAGLNPHAGESGHLGREEIDIIAPVLARLRDEGFDLTGPLPADTLFVPAQLRHFDCVLAMYHDQGLPVLKYASFGSGINVTLGLPIIRTSVDHGTALDLAGKGCADTGSLRAALDLATQLAANRLAC